MALLSYREEKLMKQFVKMCVERVLGDQNVQARKVLLRYYQSRYEIKGIVELLDNDYFKSLIFSLYTYHDPNSVVTDELFDQYGIIKDVFTTNYLLQRIRIAEIVCYLKNNIEIAVPCSILDVGDNHGFFIDSIGSDGMSVNIDEQAVSFLKRHNKKATVASAESLPFKDSSFDYVFSFECLEHLENPIKALREYARIMRKSIFITIPYTKNTHVVPSSSHHGIRRPENIHVFEFGLDDFSVVAQRAGLLVAEFHHVRIYKPLPIIHNRFYCKKFLRPAWTIIKLEKIDI